MQLNSVDALQRSLKPSAAAKILGVSVDRVYQFCKEGRFEAIKIGATWYIDPDTLQEFAKISRSSGNPNFGKSRK